MNPKPRIYVSHSIRGKFGKDATCEQMAENCQKAIRFGNYLKTYFPKIDWYVPADHDEFVTIAYKKSYLTEKQILDVDCTIIGEGRCKGVLFYMPDDYLSGGMATEKVYSIKKRKLQLDIRSVDIEESDLTLSKLGRQKIEKFIQEVIECQES